MILAAGLVSCSPAVIGRIALSRNDQGALIAVAALCEGTLTDIEVIATDTNDDRESEPIEWTGDVSDTGITEIRMTTPDWTGSVLSTYSVYGHGKEPWGLLGRPSANLLEPISVDGTTLALLRPGTVLGMGADYADPTVQTYGEFWERSCPRDE
ncbi:hypothetical protein [Microbacterium sp. NPDC057650]|uniref:hypothetical protein n=1 Tax=unclassified Microbacterium TaxID=2609290 RepID=UPI0036702121